MSKHIVLIAGEESGDIHAASLISELKSKYSDLRITGMGGTHMQQAGAEIILDLARYGVTGFTEVIRNIHVIYRALNTIKSHLKTNKPDLLILVDYPGFNLKLAQYAKEELGIKILYYISPQIWAWKAKRIHKIKKYVDHMAVILPFEKEIYTKAGVPVSFVGHPMVESIDKLKKSLPSRDQLNLPEQKQLIALLPGSRKHEVNYHMPVLLDTAKQLHKNNPDTHFVIPIAESIATHQLEDWYTDKSVPMTFIRNNALACMNNADFVIVASGTASLECALLEKPMCIIYKASFLTYYIVMKVIRVKFLGMANLLSNRMIIPEFLQDDCRSQELSRYIQEFYQNEQRKSTVLNNLHALKTSLSTSKQDCSLCALVEMLIGLISTN